MSDATQTLILEWLVGGLVTVLLMILGLVAKRWLDHVEGLQASMDKLRDSILSLSKEFVTQAQYRADMDNLRLRRAGDNCPKADCPFDDTGPGTTINLTSSGAKSLQHLFEAAKAHRVGGA